MARLSQVLHNIGSKNAQESTKRHRIVSTLIILEQYYKAGNELLSHIVRVTCKETCVSSVNVETKEQSKYYAHTFPGQVKEL
jgi:hypothetical protein